MRLRSHAAVAVVEAGSCSSDLTPILRTVCHGCSPREKKKKKKRAEKISLCPTREGLG